MQVFFVVSTWHGSVLQKERYRIEERDTRNRVGRQRVSELHKVDIE